MEGQDVAAPSVAAVKRSLVAEYFDTDGARRKRPFTRRQAKLFSQCEETVQDYADNVVDVLPDEVLLLVLSRMSSVDLLPLRLVSRRWDELVLSPAVWCRRRLSTSYFYRLADVGTNNLLRISFVLYNAPTMDFVDLRGGSFSEMKCVNNALLHGRCQMRALRCSLNLTHATEDVILSFLERVRKTQELNLTLEGAHKEDVLDAIDNAPLKTLALRAPWYSHCRLSLEDFEFRKLQTLKTLVLFDKVLSLELQRNLVSCNRDSLREVLCLPMLVPALAECTHLVNVTVKACADLQNLNALTSVEAVTIIWTEKDQLVHVRTYFHGAMQASRLPTEIHLMLACYGTEWLTEVGEGLSKVTTLTTKPLVYLSSDHDLEFIEPMLSLRVLRVPCTVYCKWEHLNSSSLRKIELLGTPGAEVKSWVRTLRVKWSAIEITWSQQLPSVFDLFGNLNYL